jgi:polysaccharide biosynthesis transport protein
LEREAKAQRDLLESYLAKYREANTRETIDTTPTEGRIISRAIVSNTPAYPKKLPIVLLATLVTLLLSAGLVATSELLRTTAPAAAFTSAVPAAVRVAKTKPAEIVAEPAPELEPVMPEPVAMLVEIDELAKDFAAAGEAARKITVLGNTSAESIALTALTLARLMARQARVVGGGPPGRSPTIAAISVDTSAPGLAELAQGDASFSDIITKDRLSSVHLVCAGRPGFDRSLLQSPRLALAIDALKRVYDHVVLDAGTASDLPAELLSADARAVVVTEPSLDASARAQIGEKLKAVGFADVAMLDKPAQAVATIEPPPRVVAA